LQRELRQKCTNPSRPELTRMAMMKKNNASAELAEGSSTWRVRPFIDSQLPDVNQERTVEMKNFVIAFALCVLVSGCATPTHVINYAPSSTMSLEGQAHVGKFTYLPAENGSVKPNQIRNTAIGNVFFEKDINEYIETALFTEARFVGIRLSDGSPLISGAINEFLIDDLGFSIDWTFEVAYEIDGCYNQTHKVERNTAKFGNVFGTLNEIIKQNIEMLFSDASFISCIQS